jgi:hypothetical protein
MTPPIPESELDPETVEPSMNGSGPTDEPGKTGGRMIRDIFDPEACLDDEDDALQVGAPVITIPVRKPDKLKYYRVHPDTWWIGTFWSCAREWTSTHT